LSLFLASSSFPLSLIAHTLEWPYLKSEVRDDQEKPNSLKLSLNHEKAIRNEAEDDRQRLIGLNSQRYLESDVKDDL